MMLTPRLRKLFIERIADILEWSSVGCFLFALFKERVEWLAFGAGCFVLCMVATYFSAEEDSGKA